MKGEEMGYISYFRIYGMCVEKHTMKEDLVVNRK